ncbi:unnamed protein product [Pedinophyceae sp. YPF-701]|nr:unnamed protein product [Pedinophyceae sp. YPF-701]
MDIQRLCECLQAATSADAGTRKQAEAALMEGGNMNGFTPVLLRVACEESVDLVTRQMAAITFKNTVTRHWDPVAKDVQQASDGDKDVIREALMGGIVASPAQVQSQLVETARLIVYCDFPSQWPQLVPQLLQALESGDETRIHGALLVFRTVARKYEFRSDENERMEAEQVTGALMPRMLELAKHLMQSASSTKHIDMLRIILKSFVSLCYSSSPQTLVRDGSLVQWLQLALAALKLPVPTEGQPEDPDERAKWCWWKLKKWAMQVAVRFYSRHSSESVGQPRTQEEKAEAELWNEQCMVPFLEAFMEQAAALSQGAYISPRCTNLTLVFLTKCLSRGNAFAVMKPHIEALVLQVAFPLLAFNDSDAVLWEEDPQEYIRKGNDVIEEFYSDRNAAASFLQDVAEKRGKAAMPALMRQIVEIFKAHESATAVGNVPVQVARAMDGALLAVGSLSSYLRKKKQYKDSLEPMLQQYVLPCFQSQYGHLRAKACWVAGSFADLKFPEGVGVGRTFGAMMSATVNAMSDPEMPVRVEACMSARCFLEEVEDVSVLKPAVPQLLQSILQLMSQVEHEDLVVTIEALVDRLGEDIGPFAVELSQHLVTSYRRFITQEADEDGEDGVLSAYGCLRAMTTVLDSCGSLPWLYPNLEAVILPVVEGIVSQRDGSDTIDEGVELLTLLTYHGAKPSQACWAMWPHLVRIVQEVDAEHFESILAPMDNLISRDTEHFLSCKEPDYLQSCWDLAQWALDTGKGLSEDAMIPACELLNVVLQNCRGRVDHIVGPSLQLALTMATQAAPAFRLLKDACMRTVNNCVYYSPTLALGYLSQHGMLQATLQTLFVLMNAKKKGGAPAHFARNRDKKVLALALLGILGLGDQELPAEVASSLGIVFQGLVNSLSWLKDGMENAKLLEEDDGDSQDDYTTEDEDFDPSGEGELRDLDNTRALEREHRREEAEHLVEEASDDDLLAIFQDIDDLEDEVEGPLDDVDPFIMASELLRAMEAQHPQRLAALMGALQPVDMQRLQEVGMYADVRRKEIAERAQEKAKEAAKREAQAHAHGMHG